MIIVKRAAAFVARFLLYLAGAEYWIRCSHTQNGASWVAVYQTDDELDPIEGGDQ